MRPRFAILAMVARLQPVALWIVFHDWPAVIMLAIPALRSVSSAPRPLYLPFGLRLGLALRLTGAAIVIVLASDGGEHVEQHAVDGLEHPACELFADPTRHRPARRQVERDDADTLGGKLSLECFPVRCSEAGQPVDLLDEETVALMGISQKPEQLRPGELGATLVLNVPSHNLEPVLGSEGLDLGPGAVGVL